MHERRLASMRFLSERKSFYPILRKSTKFRTFAETWCEELSPKRGHSCGDQILQTHHQWWAGSLSEKQKTFHSQLVKIWKKRWQHAIFQFNNMNPHESRTEREWHYDSAIDGREMCEFWLRISRGNIDKDFLYEKVSRMICVILMGIIHAPK